MNPIETGKAIASLRKAAGLTQASLAEALRVSDKAVSKWERGLACPDIALLPKLSVLLNTDIEGIVSGEAIAHDKGWKGIVYLDKLAEERVYSKPLVYFLLSNFCLVGIREIQIVGGKVKEIIGSGEQYGITIKYVEKAELEPSSCYMIIYGNSVIYGANLTRIYQRMMSMDLNIKLQTSNGNEVPILFIHNAKDQSIENIDKLKLSCDIRRFGRGIISLNVEDKKQLSDAGFLVRLIEENSGQQIADLFEISKSRGLV